jgi:adenine nucleotide transporter 17
MAKVRLQYTPSKGEKSNMTQQELDQLRYTGAIDVLQKIVRKHGILGLYKGMSTQILKAVLASAILFSSKEKFNVWTLALFSRLGKK